MNPDDKRTGPGEGIPRPLATAIPSTTSAAMGEWVRQAACAGANPETFFPASGEGDVTAKAMCAGCPVRPDCLEYSLRTGPHWGVWGGLNDTERVALARRRKRERQRGSRVVGATQCRQVTEGAPQLARKVRRSRVTVGASKTGTPCCPVR